jgi:hypothetical protein
MGNPVQITFDAHDPPKLATFWGVALDYAEQPPPPGFDSWDAFADANNIPQEDRDGFGSVVDPTGVGPRLLFLRVPEGKTAKNRMHLDIDAAPGAAHGSDERAAKIAEHAARLVAIGATEVDRRSEHGTSWIVMHDPEGNEFCVH